MDRCPWIVCGSVLHEINVLPSEHISCAVTRVCREPGRVLPRPSFALSLTPHDPHSSRVPTLNFWILVTRDRSFMNLKIDKSCQLTARATKKLICATSQVLGSPSTDQAMDLTETRQPDLYASSTIPFFFAVLCVALRFWSRWSQRANFWLDDWLILAAVVIRIQPYGYRPSTNLQLFKIFAAGLSGNLLWCKNQELKQLKMLVFWPRVPG